MAWADKYWELAQENRREEWERKQDDEEAARARDRNRSSDNEAQEATTPEGNQ